MELKDSVMIVIALNKLDKVHYPRNKTRHERTVKAALEMAHSLETAMDIAGGGITWDHLLEMNVTELLYRLGVNNIEFRYISKSERNE